MSVPRRTLLSSRKFTRRKRTWPGWFSPSHTDAHEPLYREKKNVSVDAKVTQSELPSCASTTESLSLRGFWPLGATWRHFKERAAHCLGGARCRAGKLARSPWGTDGRAHPTFHARTTRDSVTRADGTEVSRPPCLSHSPATLLLAVATLAPPWSPVREGVRVRARLRLQTNAGPAAEAIAGTCIGPSFPLSRFFFSLSRRPLLPF